VIQRYQDKHIPNTRTTLDLVVALAYSTIQNEAKTVDKHQKVIAKYQDAVSNRKKDSQEK
jgi:hypothetical protein